MTQRLAAHVSDPVLRGALCGHPRASPTDGAPPPVGLRQRVGVHLHSSVGCDAGRGVAAPNKLVMVPFTVRFFVTGNAVGQRHFCRSSVFR